jgi:hypothetical protein
LPCCIGEDACSDKWDASFSFHNHLSGRWPAMHSAGCDCTGEECQHPAHSRCTRHCHSFRFFINKVQPLPSRACQKKHQKLAIGWLDICIHVLSSYVPTWRHVSPSHLGTLLTKSLIHRLALISFRNCCWRLSLLIPYLIAHQKYQLKG